MGTGRRSDLPAEARPILVGVLATVAMWLLTPLVLVPWSVRIEDRDGWVLWAVRAGLVVVIWALVIAVVMHRGSRPGRQD